MRKTVAVFCMALISATITGCSSKENVIPASSLTTKEIYEGKQLSAAVGENGQRTIQQQSMLSDSQLRLSVNPQLNSNDVDVDVYMLHNTPKVEFSYLPNPTLYMYVQTRLSKRDQLPMPAYITEFKMSDVEKVAMPGEVSSKINGEYYER